MISLIESTHDFIYITRSYTVICGLFYKLNRRTVSCLWLRESCDLPTVNKHFLLFPTCVYGVSTKPLTGPDSGIMHPS